MLECVVCGTGPSLEKNVQRLEKLNVPIIGCGTASKLLKCDYYALGDSLHLENCPLDSVVYVTSLLRKNVNLLKPKEIVDFKETWQHAGNSGGMAITVACTLFDHIGLIGFDGFESPLEGQTLLIKHLSDLLKTWISKGKTFYSLMDKSVFNEYLSVLSPNNSNPKDLPSHFEELGN